MADHKLTEKITKRGKEQITKVDNSRTEEKMVTAKPEAEKAEAPKKKKNIIRVYHAQNASDGGKNRTKRPVQEKKPGARPQAPKTPRNAETVSKKPENQVRKPAETKAAETSVQKSAEAPKRQADNQNRNSQRPADGNQGRLQNRQPREQRDGARDNGRGRDFRGGDRRTDNRNQGDRRPSDNRGQGRPARNNEGRPFRNDGEGRPEEIIRETEDLIIETRETEDLPTTEVREDRMEITASAADVQDSAREQEEETTVMQYLLRN